MIPYQTLRELAEAGLSVIPASTDGQKRPLVKEWSHFQKRKQTDAELLEWGGRYAGIALIMGWVSGGLETIDVDTKNDPTGKIWDELYQRLKACGDFIDRCVIETTPSGGRHIFYRYGDERTIRDGNKKLAYSASNKQAIIETRGDGGICLCDPTPGYAVFQGSIEEIGTITEDERETMLEICRSFNQIAPEAEIPRSQYLTRTEGKPGDDYNNRMTRDDFVTLMTSHGWTRAYEKENVIYLTRPGKTEGVSASLFHGGRMLLHVFTSSVQGFEPSRSYDAFGTFTRLEHGGDFRKASQALSAAGYGADPEKIATTEPAMTDPAKMFLFQHYRFRRNEILGRYFYAANSQPNAWKDVDDYQINSICNRLEDHRIKISPTRMRQIVESDFSESYNPFKTWYEALPSHNGVDHIDSLADTILVPSTVVTDWKIWLTKWLVAHVQQIETGRSNHTALILRGGQGIGKTTWLNGLCPVELKDYLHVGSLKVNDKDSELKLAERFIINLDEFETMQRAEVGHLKSFMTKDTIDVRRPYAHFTNVMRRWASFVGSVNKTEFLTDDTGNRRFLIVDCEAIHHDHGIDMKRVWAQAKDMYLNGYTHYFTQSEIERLNLHNEDYRKRTMAEEIVARYFERPEYPEDWNWQTVTDICEWIHVNAEMNITISTYFMQELGAALTNAGYQSTKRKGKKGYFVVYKAKVKDFNDMDMPF